VVEQEEEVKEVEGRTKEEDAEEVTKAEEGTKEVEDSVKKMMKI
jgi:hypothetical protein